MSHYFSNSDVNESTLYVETEGHTENLNIRSEALSLDERETHQCYVHVNNLDASWSQDEDKLSLQGVTFEVNSTAPLMAVVGPVGAGKVT